MNSSTDPLLEKFRPFIKEEFDIILNFFDLCQEYDDEGFEFICILTLRGQGGFFQIEIDRDGNMIRISDVSDWWIERIISSLSHSRMQFFIRKCPSNMSVFPVLSDLEIKMLEFYPDLVRDRSWTSLTYFIKKRD